MVTEFSGDTSRRLEVGTFKVAEYLDLQLRRKLSKAHDGEHASAVWGVNLFDEGAGKFVQVCQVCRLQSSEDDSGSGHEL